MPSSSSTPYSHQSSYPYAIQSISSNDSIDSASSNLNRQRQRLEEVAALRRSADVFRRFENLQQSPSSSNLSSNPTINASQAQLERESERLRERERQRFLRERERDDRLLRDISTRAQVESQHHSSSRTSDQNQPSASASSSRNTSAGEQQHRVYLLNCKHCDNFLSDRGMKAVLLLKPNITLYSTDSTPANCGPLWTPSRFGPGGGRNPVTNGEKPVERTCECLTQTLGCYGCGSSIGYSILSPCSRCTSSVVKHQRSSNGHRTVLHCSEISVRERRYVPGEPGVNAAIPPPPVTPFSSSSNHHGLAIRYHHSYSSHHGYPYSSSSSRSSSPYSSSPSSTLSQLDPDGNIYDSPNSSYLDDLEAEKVEAAFNAAQVQAQRMAQAQQAQAANSRSGSSSGKKAPRSIKRGDPVYWSDLVAGGERAEPFNPDPVLAMPVAGR